MDYVTDGYWAARNDLLYYQYFRMIIRCVGKDAKSILDIGSRNTPYLEWFDWIPKKVAIDIRKPYQSDTVQGIEGDIHKLQFPEKFDICTCMQVLEHVPEVEPFARRLLELGNLLVVSVPYRWPSGKTNGHVHDPVDAAKLNLWFGREPNYKLLVREPFTGKKGRRLFAIYDPADPARRFGSSYFSGRRRL
jgi:hypothetical protein